MVNKPLLSTTFRRTVTAVLLFLLPSVFNAASAQTYTFAAASTGGNVFPLSSSNNMVQWMYYPTHFTPTLTTCLITKIYFNPSGSGSTTFPNLTIKMGNTTATTVPGTSWVTGLTTVYSNTSTSLTWTSNTWVPITLQTPFFYTGGNFFLEISQTGTSGMTINQNSTLSSMRQWGPVTSGAPVGSGTGQFLIGFDVLPATCSGTPLSPVVTTAAQSPANAVPCGGTYNLAASDPNAPITNISYQWQSGSSSTGPFTNVTTGTGGTTLNYTTGPLTTTTYFRMGAKCNGSGITSYSTPYTVIVGAPQPGAISGRPTTCPGDTTTYSTPNFPGYVYSWTLPAGWSFVTGTPTTGNSVQVSMGTFGGTISVSATATCGGPSVPQTKTVFQGSAPAIPPTINGSNAVCSGTTQMYSVAPVAGANSYVWSLPNGWTGTSSGNSITVVTDTTSGLVQVRAVNGCGSSANASLAVSVINSLANPGTITSSSPSGTYCSGSLYSFSIVPVSGATAYQWTLPPGWSGTISGTSIQAFASLNPGAGQVKVTAYVSCATSPTSSLSTPVTATVNPAVSISTTTTALCQGVPTTFTATPTNGGTTPGYQWKKNGANVFSSGASYTDATLVNGDMVAVVLSSNATCRSADTMRSNTIVASITPSVTPGVSINTTPVVSICAGATLNFTTTVTAPGTAPSYQWFRGSLPVATGPFWATSALSDGDTITVKLTSNAACATQPTVTSNKVGIRVSPVVVPSITASASSTTPDGSSPITFTAAQSGGGATPVYQWIRNNVDIPGATGDSYQSSSLVSGDRISVRMQSYASCAAPDVVTSNEVVMGSALGIAGAGGSWPGVVSLYPNPVVSGRLTVGASWDGAHLAGERVKVEVLNALGQVVYHSEVAPGGSAGTARSGQWHYDVVLGGEVAPGHYVLRLQAPQSNMNAALSFIINK